MVRICSGPSCTVSDLSNAELYGSDLSRAKLYGANLGQAILKSNANLSYARLG